MAAITPLIKTIVSSPQFRNALKQTGKWAGQKTLGAIQKRRVRKGKRLIFPAQPGVKTRTVSTVPPVRQNVQKLAQGQDSRLVDTEACTLSLKGGVDANGTLVYVPLDVLALSIWPKIVSKAQLYTEYSISSLSFEYVPQVGSAYNGQLAVAFTPQPNTDSATFSTPEEILALPCSTSFAVSSRATFTIPLGCMSRNGRNLFINNGISETTVDNTLYYLGTLAYRIYACTDATSSVGLWRVHYNLTLSKPRLETTAPSSTYTALKTRPGLYQLYIDAEENRIQLTTNTPTRWMIKAANATLPSLFLNNVELDPVLVVPGATTTLLIFEMRRITMRDLIESDDVTHITAMTIEPCTLHLMEGVLPDSETVRAQRASDHQNAFPPRPSFTQTTTTSTRLVAHTK